MVVASQMWSEMWQMGVPLGEKVLRTLLVYLGLVVLLRVAGKRELAQLNAFDLVVLLLLSNVVQNAVIGPDDSVTGGLIGAAVLIAVNAMLVRASVRSDRFTELFEGNTTDLVVRGDKDRKAMEQLGLRDQDLMAALRQQGAARIDDVERASLAPNGTLTLELRDQASPATQGELLRVERKLDALLERFDEGGSFGS